MNVLKSTYTYYLNGLPRHYASYRKYTKNDVMDFVKSHKIGFFVIAVNTLATFIFTFKVTHF